MNDINNQGLKRRIPEPIKLVVRQECGFGCAYCGQALVEYHHFDPPFRDAHEHRSEGIILLCPNCHTKFGHLPAERIREIRSSPRCRRDGFARDDFFVSSTQMPKIVLGKIVATSGQILRHGNRVLLGLLHPEQAGAPLRLTCELHDERNVLILKIRDNEIVVGVDHFDVMITTTKLQIKRKKKDVILCMTTNRSDEVCITHLETAVAGGALAITPQHGFTARSALGGTVSVSGTIRGEIGMWITEEGMCLLGGGPSTAAGVALRWI